jgi:hypothetical protein
MRRTTGHGCPGWTAARQDAGASRTNSMADEEALMHFLHRLHESVVTVPGKGHLYGIVGLCNRKY